MTKREIFIIEIEEILNSFQKTLSADAQEYFEDLKLGKEEISNPLTETGAKILQFMQTNKTKYLNLFTAKIIGEALFMNSRSVSGSMRKLITDGYVKKEGANPVTYSLTENEI